MPIAQAKAMGAMALFGEKYGDIVRVVQAGDYSIELCGGCHVRNTAHIGLFKIVSESGIGSGIRRIEAVTGRHAYAYMEQQLDLVRQSAVLLKSGLGDVPKRIESLLQQLKELSRDNERLNARLGKAEAAALVDRVKTVDGVSLLAAQVDAKDMDALRNVLDQVKAKLPSGVIVLGAVSEGKVNLVAAVTPDLVHRGLHAGQIVKETAARCGGGGGGRPDLAQAGGKDPSQLQAALERVEELVKERIGAK
jgi:alanyl-tRNA synthetase